MPMSRQRTDIFAPIREREDEIESLANSDKPGAPFARVALAFARNEKPSRSDLASCGLLGSNDSGGVGFYIPSTAGPTQREKEQLVSRVLDALPDE